MVPTWENPFGTCRAEHNSNDLTLRWTVNEEAQRDTPRLCEAELYRKDRTDQHLRGAAGEFERTMGVGSDDTLHLRVPSELTLTWSQKIAGCLHTVEM